MKNYISYSQNLEDVILKRVFKDIDTGFYVDIGAWHPEKDSVTKAFYESGWSGINIEPTRFYWNLLTKERVRDINLNIAISDHTGNIVFSEIPRSGLSSIEAESQDFGKSLGFTVKQVTVACDTLNSIFEKNIRSDQVVHFLKIDVEGHERNVLQGLDLKKHRPVVILVEAIHPETQAPQWDLWEHLILNFNYSFIYFDGLNRFYLRNEDAFLSSKFRASPNILDGFLLARNHRLVMPITTQWRLRLERWLPPWCVASLRYLINGLFTGRK
jgi:FkbM family methyltransferase